MCSAKASLYIYVVFSIPLQGACHVNLYKCSVCNVGFSIKQCAPIAGGEVRKGWSCFPCIAFSSFHSHNCVTVKLCCDSDSDVTSSVSQPPTSQFFTHTTLALPSKNVWCLSYNTPCVSTYAPVAPPLQHMVYHFLFFTHPIIALSQKLKSWCQSFSYNIRCYQWNFLSL